ncbi:MAG: ribonuclease III [Lachnospiraceae bacterium]|nr:ribonuclease III [Candidatus Merdinaster equi]
MTVEETLNKVQEIIEYHFVDVKKLQTALTHSSYANERKINKCEDYERYEFLGDAVLEMVSSEFLFLSNPQMKEGEMTRLRASMVCEVALAFCAKELGIGQYIFLGKGEDESGGRFRPSVTSDVMEAIIGAIFLDGGLSPAKHFIHNHILNDLDEKKLFYDSKSLLQVEVQKNVGWQLRYEVLKEEGPEHNKMYTVGAYINDVLRAEGSGQNKKAAEQEAAYKILLEQKNSPNHQL